MHALVGQATYFPFFLRSPDHQQVLVDSVFYLFIPPSGDIQ